MPGEFKDYEKTHTDKAKGTKTPGVKTVKDFADQFKLERLEHPLITEV